MNTSDRSPCPGTARAARRGAVDDASRRLAAGRIVNAAFSASSTIIGVTA